MIKAVLYDMDGTVLDTMPIYGHGWGAADEAYSCGGRLVEMLPLIAGMNEGDIEAFICSRLGEDFPCREARMLMKRVISNWFEEHGVACKKGAPEIFDRIRSLGIKQILVTSSSPALVFPHLAMAGIEDAFDAVITGDMVTHSKPNPEIFLLGAKAAECKPDECVVVEDANNGARAGIAAGMHTVMIPEFPPVPADVALHLWRECSDLSELYDLIVSYNRSNS